MNLRSLFGRSASTLLILTLAACGGGGGDSSPATYTIGGAVTGLAAGTQIVLSDNGSDPLTVSANAAYAFAKPVDANGAYLVTITTQPAGQTCSVANFSGAGVTANVANVNITCSAATHTVAGTVAGLAVGQNVVLTNNGADATSVSINGAFAFALPVALNGSYAVTVGTQPTGQMCTVANGTGAGVTADITSVAVTCSTNTYTIGGTVAGLTAGHQVTLNNNSANPTTVAANGAFTFSTPVTSNGTYAVTVGTQPTGQTCTVANGTGAGVTANVANVTVTCSTNTYTIGGTVAGLTAGKQVTLNNNSANPTTVGANGMFTFSTPVTFNGAYAVTVGTQPAGQTCTIANGTGAGVTANVANVTVTCSTNTYTVSGTVAGLTAGKQVTLNNNSANPTTVAANGAFSFSTAIASGSAYVVTVGTQPAGQTCTVANGTGSNVTANVTNITVTCSTNTYTIGGTVSGLTAGKQVTLNNNGANPTTVPANGAFSFSTTVASGGSYAVTVGTQPVGQTCTVANGSGSGVTASVANINVTCSVNTFTIGGNVSGLASGQQVTLVNGSDVAGAATVTVDGAYTFTTPVTYNGNYAVTVGTQPVGQTCTVANGSGAGVTANVANVNVTCSVNTFTVGGVVSGLTSSQFTLVNGADVAGAVTVTANGPYTFATPVAYNGNYGAVTVGTQPIGQTCTVVNPSGAGVTADVVNVNVTCSVNTYTISGSVTGLTSGQVTLLNNGDVASAQTVTTNNGTFAFTVAYRGNYGVTVGTRPVGKTCSVSNGSGTSVSANVSNVGVVCAVNTFTISGTVTGLVAGTPAQQVTLLNNLDVPTAQTATNANASFSFTVPYGGSYALTVGTQPTGETCRITSGTGTNVQANATVVVTCRLALAYVVNATAATVSQYTIGLDGALTSLAAPISTGGIDPNVVTVDPTGRFAYVTNFGSNTLAQFSIDAATGALTSLGVVPTGSTPYSVAVTDRYVYVTNQDDAHGATNSISQFTIGSDGRLTAIGSGTVPLPVGAIPYQITIDPAGRHAYVASKFAGGETGTGAISQFDIDAITGALTPMATPQVLSGNWSIGIAINPAGTFAYVSNIGANTVSRFSIDGATGALTGVPAIPQATENRPYPIAISTDGQFAYWANKGSNSISQCKINPDGSLPSGTNTTLAGNHPQYTAIDPFSRHVYVVNVADVSFNDGQGSTVSQYDIDPAAGLITPISGAPTVSTGLGPFSITTTR